MVNYSTILDQKRSLTKKRKIDYLLEKDNNYGRKKKIKKKKKIKDIKMQFVSKLISRR